ncbi:MAG: hypothetical protein WBD97_20335, partial [Pseudolabrys sp.]
TIAKVPPALLDRLRQWHNIFQSLMRTNLTVWQRRTPFRKASFAVCPASLPASRRRRPTARLAARRRQVPK